MTDQGLLRISFGLLSFIFELVLFVMLMVLGHGQRGNNMKYRTLVILVMVGNVVSILDNIFRVSDQFETPQIFQIFLQLSALVVNVFLSYYVFLYLGTFVKERRNPPLRILNNVLVWGSVAIAAFLFIQAVVRIGRGEGAVSIPAVGRIIIGYAVELYFLLFSMFLVIYYRKSFGRRPFFTALAAYIAIISTIILQLLDKNGFLLNYIGAVIGSYIFYIGVEIPDHRNLKKSMDVVQALAEAIDAKDTYTHGHSGRVAAYSREIAKRAGLSDQKQNDVYMMGLLHDVGKIGVNDAVINKQGRLTDEEFADIKSHPEMGARILKSIKEMPELVTGAMWHHERYDGTGYPDGLAGEKIPKEARIIAVADAYDAMSSNRSYRKGMEQEKVREQIESGKGTQFDPAFADIMLSMIDEDKEYRMREM